MATQDTRLFDGTPAQFAEVVKRFAADRRRAGQAAPYVLRPEPMPPDPGQVLCTFGGDPWHITGTVAAKRVAKGQVSLTVDASAEAWPAVKGWWLLLADHLQAEGWLYVRIDQAGGRNAMRDGEIFRLHQEDPERWTAQRLANKFRPLGKSRVYQILRDQRRKNRGV